MSTADWMSALSHLMVTSPLAGAGCAVAGSCVILYGITRMNEWLIAAATAGVYAAAAAVPVAVALLA